MASALLTTTQIPLLFLSTAAVKERICLSVVVSVSSLLATLAFIAWADALQADVALCMCAPFYCCWVHTVMVSSTSESDFGVSFNVFCIIRVNIRPNSAMLAMCSSSKFPVCHKRVMPTISYTAALPWLLLCPLFSIAHLSSSFGFRFSYPFQ